MIHMRYDDSRPSGNEECVCGEVGCRLYWDDVQLIKHDKMVHCPEKRVTAAPISSPRSNTQSSQEVPYDEG